MAALVRRPTLAVLVLLTGAVLTLAAGPAEARGTPWPGHPDRRIVIHVVRPGDTGTGLAVRYHAWTRELIALNRLGPRAVLRVGDRVRVPVVVSAVHRTKPVARPQVARDEVRAMIGRVARRHGVPVRLARAVAWQESGWQQSARSSAGAIGVMQVLPGTGMWMSLYAHRPLDLRDTHDNITAGVTLLRVLLDETRSTRRAGGAYYQGLAGVRRHGLLPETRRYVANVLALRDQL
jgi:soluble lytic murein transglycosylase-like protein